VFALCSIIFFLPNRFSLYGGEPVQLSAYLVDTEVDTSSTTPLQHGYGADSDSGISDTDQSPSSQKAEEDNEGETAHGQGMFEENFGLRGILTPPPEVEEEKPEVRVLGHTTEEEEQGLTAVAEATVDLFSDEESVFFEDEEGLVFGPEIPAELVEAGIPEIEDHGAIQAIIRIIFIYFFFLTFGHWL
jgi:hypothetical protein